MVKISEALYISQMPRRTPLLDFHHWGLLTGSSASSLDVGLSQESPKC